MKGRAIAGLAALAVALGLIGMLLSGYLVIENLQGDTGVCVGVHGCATVQDSRYGKLFGVPVSIPGFALYAGLTLCALAWWRGATGRSQQLAATGFFGAFAGLAFSGYLTYIEAFVLDAWCSYCIASAILMVALFLTWSLILWVEMRKNR